MVELPKMYCWDNPIKTLENIPFCGNLHEILILNYPHLDWLPIKDRLLTFNLFLDKYHHNETMETLVYPDEEGKICEESLKILLPFPLYSNYDLLKAVGSYQELTNLTKLCRILLTSLHYPDWDFTSLLKTNLFDFIYSEKDEKLIKFKQAAMKIIEQKGMF